MITVMPPRGMYEWQNRAGDLSEFPALFRGRIGVFAERTAYFANNEIELTVTEAVC